MTRLIDKKEYRLASLIGLAVVLTVCLGWLVIRSMLMPKLFVLDVDFGTYVPGQTVERAMCLENQGSADLLINDVVVCCGMSLVGDFPKRLAAGSTGVITLRLRAPNGPTRLEKYITLHTNDPREPIKKVFVRGAPDSPVYTTSSIDLRYLVAGGKVEKAAVFLLPEGERANFSMVTRSPTIWASSPRRINATRLSGREYDTFVADVGVDEQTPRGLLQEYIYVKTGLAGRPYIVIAVKGIVERGLRAQPQQVFFGLVKDESVMNRVIRLDIIGPGWDSARVTSSECPGVEAKLQRKSETAFELQVSLDPTTMPEKLKSHITLLNSSGDTIQIPVLAMRKTL